MSQTHFSDRDRNADAVRIPTTVSPVPGAVDAVATAPQADDVSDEHLEAHGTDVARVSEPLERQAVDVKPMRYVLVAGIVGAVGGMALAYMLLSAGGSL